MIDNISKQSRINEIYLKIADIAELGDLFFFINHYPLRTLKGEVDGKNWKAAIKYYIRAFYGCYMDDLDTYHLGVNIGWRKRKYHNKINLWFIHSRRDKGVHIQQITPGMFKNTSLESRSRVEILRFEGVSKEQRKIIVKFSNSKIGYEWDKSRLRYKILPFAFGLLNVRHKQNQFSCQQLAIAAYGAAGIHFPHPYKSFPIFNIGRYLGHPLGHPKDRVDPRDPYLMGHHIYRDPRFVLKAAVYQDPTTDEIILQTENLKKYSWNESLRETYIKKGYLDP
jgi:hypothetical protein